MFSSAANTINSVSSSSVIASGGSSSTNKCYNYPGPFKSERKWAQDIMSKWVQEWLDK
jgi:hypothetical protein